MTYITTTELEDLIGEIIPEQYEEREIIKASHHIDTLTFNRINRIGFENLTTFQRNIIKEVCASIAQFDYENADILDSVLQSYSINGVSMNFNSTGWNVIVQNGIALKSEDYDLLSQTGLTCLSFRI